MRQLLITQLPREITGEDIVLRHTIVMDDGRIFFQDEYILSVSAKSSEHDYKGRPEFLSDRTDWQELPTPPELPRPICAVMYGPEHSGAGFPQVLYSDGVLRDPVVDNREIKS